MRPLVKLTMAVTMSAAGFLMSAAAQAAPCSSPPSAGDKDCVFPANYEALAAPAVGNGSGGHAVWFSNASRFGAQRFIFDSDAVGTSFTQDQWFQPGANGLPTDGVGTFVKNGDTATLTGTVVAGTQNIAGRTGSDAGAITVDQGRGFEVVFNFAYIGDGKANSVSGTGKRELPGGQYAESGGPVDVEDWSFFNMTSASLVGTGALAGLELTLFQVPTSGTYPFQSGLGANGKNLDTGLSGWFGWTVTANEFDVLGLAVGSTSAQFGEHGDVNIDWDVVPEPASIALLGAGLLGLAGLRRRRR